MLMYPYSKKMELNDMRQIICLRKYDGFVEKIKKNSF